jgi:hypothetical protein
MMKPGDFSAGRYRDYPLVTSPLEPDQKTPGVGALIPVIAGATSVRERLRLRRGLQLDLGRLAAAELAAALGLGVDLGP